MRALAVALALLLLSGCAAPAKDTAPTTAGTGTGTVCVGPDARPAPPASCAPSGRKAAIADHLSVAWQGALGTTVTQCTPAVCTDQGQGADSERSVQLPPGNLTAVHVELTWTSTTPATAKLTLGVMAMGAAGSTAPFAKEVTGASPLVLDEPSLRAALDGSQTLHVYVYNPTVMQGASGTYLYASPDQAFGVKGNATVLSSAWTH